MGELPRFLSSFVGRETELAQLLKLVDERRQVTLVGAGGCGKTRLALRAATEVMGGFPDGVSLVELAPITDDHLVAPLLTQVLGIRPLPGATDLDAAVGYLAPRQALVVFDNCEHLLPEVARVVEALVRGCPRLRVVATSRAPLRCEGETEWRVPSLSEPDAIQLFVDRAAHIVPGLELSGSTTPSVARICRELDGIPLAIELAAARLRMLSIDQLETALADRFRVLTGGARTMPPRHQALRASLDWSYDLLEEDARVLLRRLSVFHGGFSLEAAESVGAISVDERRQVLDVLSALVEHSLVQPEAIDTIARYRLLETVRQYAFERLEDADEVASTQDRHRDFFVEFVERIAPDLLTPRQREFLELLDPEAANLAVAIVRAATTESEMALRLSAALTLWWRQRSRFAQGEAGFTCALAAATEPSALRARALWGRAFLLTFAGNLGAALPASQEAVDAAEAVGDASTAARALFLIGLPTMWLDPRASRPGLERARELATASGDDFAKMHATQALAMSEMMQDENPRARPLHEQAFTLAERLGQQDAMAWYWIGRAMEAWIAGDVVALRDTAETALEVARGVGDVVTEAAATFGLAVADSDSGHADRVFARCRAMRERAVSSGGGLLLGGIDMGLVIGFAAAGRLDEARAECESMVDRSAAGWMWVLARTHALRAEVLRLLGDTDGAVAAADQAIAHAEQVGSRCIKAEGQVVQGQLASGRGDWAEAQRLLHEALPVSAELGSPRLPRVLSALAGAAAGLESFAEAARLIGGAERLWRDAGIVQWPHQQAESHVLGQTVAEALGVDEFGRLVAEGEALDAAEIVAYVRRARGERRRPATGWASLTPTELEVAGHAANGLTNPEIANRMFISRLTVRTHLTHIFAKLSVRNRSELAREAARRQ